MGHALARPETEVPSAALPRDPSPATLKHQKALAEASGTKVVWGRGKATPGRRGSEGLADRGRFRPSEPS